MGYGEGIRLLYVSGGDGGGGVDDESCGNLVLSIGKISHQMDLCKFMARVGEGEIILFLKSFDLEAMIRTWN